MNENEIRVSKAKDDLLTKMYHARYKRTLGGYEMWCQLVRWYASFDYQEMYDYIKSLGGTGGKTRSECLKCLEIIIGGERNG
jgi:hypothetical protein